MIGRIAEINCSGIPNISFLFPNAYSCILDVRGHLFHVQHGDDIKMWNSIPHYGIERNTRRLKSIHSVHGTNIKYFVMGHFHQLSTQAQLDGKTILNGAWRSPSPFEYGALGAFTEPKQLIHGVHDKHGMTWSLEVDMRKRGIEYQGERYLPALEHHFA
jgi:hypothetical protein